MPFTAPAEHYDRFMGRYAPTLTPALADAAAVRAGMRVLDVGCGPGGLTAELAARVGAERVAAIDPAPQFVAACRERHPGADVREGVAEALPWDDDSFDAALSSLVVAFMSDPDLGLREMARVTRPGGTVAACMWDLTDGGMAMLATYWAAVRDTVDDQSAGEARRPGSWAGDLTARMARAGVKDVAESTLVATAGYRDFDDYWVPFTLAVGPAGEHLRSLDDDRRAAVREACRAALPGDGPFTLSARAWCAVGTAPG